MQSESIDKLIPAFVKAQSELEHAKKDSKNPHFKSSYADLASVMDAIKEPLKANSLAITHQREQDEAGNQFLVTKLWHSTGQWIGTRSMLNPARQDAQGWGSAITYGRRYDISALLGLASDDDDGNAASGDAPPMKKFTPARRSELVEIHKDVKSQIAIAESSQQLDGISEKYRDDLKDIKSWNEDYYGEIIEAGKAQRVIIAEMDAAKASGLVEGE